MTPCVFVRVSQGRSSSAVSPAEVAALTVPQKLSIPSSPKIHSLCNSLINKQQHQAAFEHHLIGGALSGSGTSSLRRSGL